MQPLILNIPFNNITSEGLMEALDAVILQNAKSQVCFVPVNSILAARKDPEVLNVYRNADFVICDGVPVKWASRFLGTPIVERITGLDFMPDYVKHCADKGFSLFFLGAAPGVAEALQRNTQPCTRISKSKGPILLLLRSISAQNRMMSCVHS